jgi:hypothetical protein
MEQMIQFEFEVYKYSKFFTACGKTPGIKLVPVDVTDTSLVDKIQVKIFYTEPYDLFMLGYNYRQEFG